MTPRRRAKLFLMRQAWRAGRLARAALRIPPSNPFDPDEHPYAYAMFQKYPDAEHGVLMAAAWADLGAHMEGLTGEDVQKAIERIRNPPARAPGPVQTTIDGEGRA